MGTTANTRMLFLVLLLLLLSLSEPLTLCSPVYSNFLYEQFTEQKAIIRIPSEVRIVSQRCSKTTGNLINLSLLLFFLLPLFLCIRNIYPEWPLPHPVPTDLPSTAASSNALLRYQSIIALTHQEFRMNFQYGKNQPPLLTANTQTTNQPFPPVINF